MTNKWFQVILVYKLSVASN